MTNAEIVREFTETVFNGRDLSVIDRYMHDDYIQHNPTVAQGKTGFLDFAANRFFKNFPELRLNIKHIYEAGDFVICHNHAVLKAGETENVVFDVYRLDGGKLAEHWDCIQRLTPEQISVSDKFF